MKDLKDFEIHHNIGSHFELVETGRRCTFATVPFLVFGDAR